MYNQYRLKQREVVLLIFPDKRIYMKNKKKFATGIMALLVTTNIITGYQFSKKVTSIEKETEELIKVNEKLESANVELRKEIDDKNKLISYKDTQFDLLQQELTELQKNEKEAP